MASTSKLDEDNQKTLQREIRNMVSTLTQKLTQVHSTKHGSGQRLHDEDGRGSSIITLAGNNTGATMRADLREKLEGHAASKDDQGMQETLGAYANSNYQSVNNSIMMNASYSAEDPGIHIDVSDFVEHDHDHEKDHEKLKEEKKKKKKEEEKKKKKKKHSDSDSSEEDSSDTEGKESKREEALDNPHEKTSDGDEEE